MSLLSDVVSIGASSTSAAPPKYRLTYFHSQGRGEVIRLLFALAHEAFVDERLTESSSASSRPVFDALKGSLPFGQLPVLRIDGEGGPVLAQSHAIERFLARRFGLMGGSEVEEQVVDSVTEAVRDLTQAYAGSRADAAAQQRFLAHTLPAFLEQLHRLAQRSNRGSAHNTLVGGTLTLADVVVYHIFSVPTPDQPAMQRLIDGYPLIKAAIAHVAERPEIREWIATRPA